MEAVKLIVFLRSGDAKGTDVWVKVGESDTWRGTHEFRTLRKEQRTRDGRQVMSYVYDSAGNLRSTP